MQVLSSQRNNGKSEDVAGANSGSDCPNEDSLGGESMEGIPDNSGDDHPALRGVQAGKWNFITFYNVELSRVCLQENESSVVSRNLVSLSEVSCYNCSLACGLYSRKWSFILVSRLFYCY